MKTREGKTSWGWAGPSSAQAGIGLWLNFIFVWFLNIWFGLICWVDFVFKALNSRLYCNCWVDQLSISGAHYNTPGHTIGDMRVTILEKVFSFNPLIRKERDGLFISFNTKYKGLNKKWNSIAIYFSFSNIQWIFN